MSTSSLRTVSTLGASTLAEIEAVVTAMRAGVGSALSDAPRGTRVVHTGSGAEWVVQQFGNATGSRLVQATGDFTTFVTNADLSAEVGKLVKLNAQKVILANAIGEPCMGALTYVETAAADSRCVIRRHGPAFVINTGGITKGDGFKTTAAGLASSALTGSVVASPNISGSLILGVAIETALTGVAGLVFMTPGGFLPNTYT